MDDRRIEEMLRESWKPEPPDGMRERVLRRARGELAHSRQPVLGMSRWKFALASLGLLVILLANISDHARQIRLSATMHGSPLTKMTAPYTVKGDLLAWRREIQRSLVLAPTGAGLVNGLKGDDLL